MIRIPRPTPDNAIEICKYLYINIAPNDNRFEVFWEKIKYSHSTVSLEKYGWQLDSGAKYFQITAPEEHETYLVLKYGVAEK